MNYPPQYPNTSPVPYGTPAPYGPPAPYGQPGPQQAFTLGNITVQGDTIYFPGGSMPLRGTTVTITDRTVLQDRTSQTGIVLAVLLFVVLCVFSLLFLLMKEQVVQGWYEVGVYNGGVSWTTQVPVNSPQVRLLTWQQAEYLRALAAQA